MQKRTYFNHKKKFTEEGYVVIKNFFSKKIVLNAKKEIFHLSKYLTNDKSNLIFKEAQFDYFIKNSLKRGPEFSSKL